MPIRIAVDKESGLNAIPVDFFVRAFGAIRENKRTDGVFHIVNSRRTKIEDIIGFAQKIFHIRGISACPAQEMEGKPRNALEAAFETYLEACGPYMRDRRFSGGKAG
jgi:hypothetical protein